MRRLAPMGAVTLLVFIGAIYPFPASADITNTVDHSIVSDNAAGGNGFAAGQGLGTNLIGVLTQASMFVHAETPFFRCLQYTLNEYATSAYGQASRTNFWRSSPLFCGSGVFDGQYTAAFSSVPLDPSKYYLIGPDTQADTAWSAIQIYGDASTSYNGQPVGSFDSNGFWGANYPDKQIKSAWFSLTGVSTTSSATSSQISNVLFLPGIEGSRLYDGAGNQLWEPAYGSGDQATAKLALDTNGKSVDPTIHTTENGVLDTAYTADVYATFLASLNEFCTQQKIVCYKDPYDWRLSLSDLIANGTDVNGNISYTTASDTPYLLQTLKALAAASGTGKVTIIAHSNGGLVAKALMNVLGPSETARLIDKVIFVAVPQSGAPATVAQLLVGYDAGIPDFLPDSIPFHIINAPAVRQLALNSPMAYHLLPSDRYFSDAQDPAHPVISFTGQHLYSQDIAAYGSTTTNTSALYNYLLATANDRSMPAPSDLDNPSIGNPALVQYAQNIHAALDQWTPPAGVSVYQIAGWGVNTLAGIDFYEQPKLFGGYESKYQPDFIEDGDGTVPVPSALMIPVSGNVSSYWMDLHAYFQDNRQIKNHSTLLSTLQLQQLIQNILASTTYALPTYFSTTPPLSTSLDKELHFFIHSPVSLDVYDDQGHHTGLEASDALDEQIPGSHYGEFGEVKYITVPTGNHYIVKLHGQSVGNFSLGIQETQYGNVLGTTTFIDIPTTASTTAAIGVTNDINAVSFLTVDENGDGTIDYTLQPVLNGTVTIPLPSLTVTANNKSMTMGGTVPAFDAIISGFLAGDSATTSATGTALCTTPVTSSSQVGSYPITCTTGSLASTKYVFNSFAPGILSIVYRWDGFLQPINDTGHQIGQNLSVFKAGSTVPVKLQLKKADGTPVKALVAPIWLAPQRGTVMSSAVDETVYTDPSTSGTNFTWDAGSQQYTFNWSTKGLAAGYWYRIFVKLDDGTVQSVTIGLR